MTREEAKNFMWIENDKNPTIIKWQHHSTISGLVSNLIDQIFDEHEALQQPKRCDGCLYGKTTINSVICGKNGTYKEADDYCKYYNPKEQ